MAGGATDCTECLLGTQDSCLLHHACAVWRNTSCVFRILTCVPLSIIRMGSTRSSCPFTGGTMWCVNSIMPAGRLITCQGAVRPASLSNSVALQQILKCLQTFGL